jgi:adenosylhomocysteine nucleosidase
MRRVLSHVLLVSLIAALGCSQSLRKAGKGPADQTSYLVVMSAFPPELTRLLEEATVKDTVVVGGCTCNVGTLAGTDIILVLSGIGLANAAATTRAVLGNFNVTAIVFSGIAGGINPGLRIGDVTVPARWGQADGDLDPNDEDFWIPVDTAMLEVARRIAATVPLDNCTPDSTCLEHDPQVITDGNGISNSFFVDDAEYRQWLWETFEANAVDMETSAVARVAHSNGVPYIAFRSLSDLAGGGPGENEIETFFQLAADNAAAFVLVFLDTLASVTAAGD